MDMVWLWYLTNGGDHLDHNIFHETYICFDCDITLMRKITWSAIYSMDHTMLWFCFFVMVWLYHDSWWIYTNRLSILLRVPSLALVWWQYRPNASDVTLNDMGWIYYYQTIKKITRVRTVCTFPEIYGVFVRFIRMYLLYIYIYRYIYICVYISLNKHSAVAL